MTECEKLIKEGFIAPEFLRPEIRNDYQISTETKKVWAIEMDLLNQLAMVCKKEKLTWYVGYGTLLGTIRHGGFIPWDDDLDIWMPRADYDRLVEIAQEYFSFPYFFQTTLNDDDYYSSYARLRNSNTTGVWITKNKKCNNGIYMDIMPIDGHGKNKLIQKIRYNYIYLRNIAAHAYAYNFNPRLVTRVLSKALRSKLIPFDMRKNYLKVNEIARRNDWDASDEIGIMICAPYSYDHNTFPKRCFQTVIYKAFEHLSVPVPGGYDEILRIIYGDYMKFPPQIDRGSWHGFEFEPDVPYMEYYEAKDRHNQYDR